MTVSLFCVVLREEAEEKDSSMTAERQETRQNDGRSIDRQLEMEQRDSRASVDGAG